MDTLITLGSILIGLIIVSIVVGATFAIIIVISNHKKYMEQRALFEPKMMYFNKKPKKISMEEKIRSCDLVRLRYNHHGYPKITNDKCEGYPIEIFRDGIRNCMDCESNLLYKEEVS